MRRTDKEITDQQLLAHIIEQAQVCRLGLAKDNIPYVLPVSFGYDGTAIYFHTAKEGRKIDFMTASLPSTRYASRFAGTCCARCDRRTVLRSAATVRGQRGLNAG